MKELIKKNKKIIILAAVLIVWVGFMLFLSSQNGTDTENTSSFFAKFFADLFYDNPQQWQVLKIDLFFRKAAHVFIYAVFGGILYFVASCFKMKKRYKFGLCCGIVILVSFLDELHKLPIAGRHFDIPDVLLNIVGGVVVLLIITLFSSRKQFKSDKNIK